MLEGFTPFGEDHPLDLPVATMAARVRDKDDALTAVELVKTALLRIELMDPGIQAFLHVTGELALEQAAAVDAKVQAGEDPGPLAGVPLGVKDNLAVPGAPLTCASKILEGYHPPAWATSVERAVAAVGRISSRRSREAFARVLSPMAPRTAVRKIQVK